MRDDRIYCTVYLTRGNTYKTDVMRLCFDVVTSGTNRNCRIRHEPGRCHSGPPWPHAAAPSPS